MVVPAAVAHCHCRPIAVLSIAEVLEGSGGDSPVQRLESLLDGSILQNFHLPRKQPLQLDLGGGNTNKRLINK